MNAQDVGDEGRTQTARGTSKRNTKVKKSGAEKSKKSKPQKEKYPCGVCQYNYGDRNDPKYDQDWLPCIICQTYFHLSCAEIAGILDDDESFTCQSCYK